MTAPINIEEATRFFTLLYSEEIPDDARLVVSSLDPDKRSWKHEWFTGLQSATNWAMSQAGERHVYFGVALRQAGVPGENNGKRGTKEETYSLPGVWCDLDFGSVGHANATFQDEEEAKGFLDQLPLAPSIIVHTGGGFHVYWIFTQPLTLQTDASIQLAENCLANLKNWFERHGIKAEAMDRSAILRVPGTINHKTGRQRPVLIIECNDDLRYSPNELISVYRPESEAEKLVKQCAFMQDCYENALKVSEPMWHAMGTILSVIDGGEDIFHELSAKDSRRYDQKNTAEKWQHVSSTSPGPRLCENLTLTNGEKCPHLGVDKRCSLPNGGRTPAALMKGQSFDMIDEMNAQFALITRVSIRILHEYWDEKQGRHMFDLITRADFDTLTAAMPKVKRDNRWIAASTHWLQSPRRRELKGIDFIPDGQREDYYNLWQGFAVEPDSSGCCKRYLDHLLENVCQGNQEYYEYLLNWMADAVQNPAKKPGVSIVLQSEERGTGKGTAVKYFGELFGEQFLELHQSSHLFGNFNAHLRNALIVFADEAFWAGVKSDAGVLKAMVTSEQHMIEPKGKDPYSVPNYIHLIIATNENWAVPAAVDERRFFVLEVGSKHKQDTAYFAAIEDEMNNGGREALLYFLKTRDLKNVDLRKYPETGANVRQKILTNPLLAFIHERVKDGEWFLGDGVWHQQVSRSKLHSRYLGWLREMGRKGYNGTQNDFTDALMKLCPEGYPKETRPRDAKTGRQMNWHLEFPAWREMKSHLETTLGTIFDWEAPVNDPENYREQLIQALRKTELKGFESLEAWLEEVDGDESIKMEVAQSLIDKRYAIQGEDGTIGQGAGALYEAMENSGKTL